MAVARPALTAAVGHAHEPCQIAGQVVKSVSWAWYQSGIIAGMAMTLRLTDAEQAALRERAAADGISMQDAARRAVRDYVAGRAHEDRVGAAADRVIAVHADALDRLGR